MTGQRPRRTRPFPPRTVWDDAPYRFDPGGTPETFTASNQTSIKERKAFHLHAQSSDAESQSGHPCQQWLCPYQWLSRGVQLVFGASQQKILSQDVQSLSAPLGAVVHLCFPQLVLIERSAAQEPAEQTVQALERSNDSVMCLIYISLRRVSVGVTK